MSLEEGLKEFLAGNHSACVRILSALLESRPASDPLLFWCVAFFP
jgi:hypothetical protein